MSKFNSAFWDWFGDSKVVNNRRNPLIVYHGTCAEFDEFEITRDLGFHFGTKQQAEYVAETCAREGGGRPAIVAAYLRIVRPFKIDYDPQWWTPMELENAERELEDRHSIDPEKRREFYKLRKKFDAALDSENRPEARKIAARYRSVFREALTESRYDGIVYPNEAEGPGKSWVIFKSSQAKSIGNDGSWDIDDPNIQSNPRRRR